MRENKCRGKRLDHGQWVYGGLITDNKGNYGIAQLVLLNNCVTSAVRLIDPATVGQYWRTINGKELFGGDIFRFKVGDEWIVRLVRYSEDQAAFCIINPSQLKHEKWMEIEQIPDASWWKEFVKDIEIIGNIHDNPELLKTE